MLSDTFFAPQSLAVIGASRNPDKVGHIVIQNLLDAGYEGDIYPINPHAEEIAGIMAYANIKHLPSIPELTVIAVPVAYILEVFEEACKAGCQQFIVFTAGFKEAGEEGKHTESKLQQLAEEYHVSLLGPNCLGLVHTPSKLNATFAQVMMQAGSARIVSQSGAIASAFFDRAGANNLGFTDCITLGNKTVMNEIDLLEFWSQTPSQGPIGCYLEQLSDGQAFWKMAKQISKQQPLLLLKPGKSEAAQSAMQSHTGSIAGSDKVLQAACDQAGIVRCNTIKQLFNGLMYFSWQPAPAGNRVAIISNAGGPGVVATDLIEDNGLQVASLSDKTKQKLQELLPRAAGLNNPIDVLGDAKADRYRDAIQVVIDDNAEVDMILIVLTPQIMTQIRETAELIAELANTHQMPIVCAFIGEQHVHAGQHILHQHQVPCFSYPSDAIQTLADAYKWSTYAQLKQEAPILFQEDKTDFFASSTSGPIQDIELEKLLIRYGISLPQSTSVESLEIAKVRAQQVGYPIVAKISSPELLHKFEYHALITNITNDQALEEAYAKLFSTCNILEQKGFSNVQIRLQQQITNGVECIIGYKYDTTFGRTILFGPGGTLTELFHDHHMLLLPASKEELSALIESSSLAPLLHGFRGRKPVDKSALLDLLEKVVQLVQSTDRIEQFEINPIIVNDHGAFAVDPKMILK